MEFNHLDQLLAHHWGTWVCQRTRFYLDGRIADHGKAYLHITDLPPDTASPLRMGMVLAWSENNQPVGRATLAFDPNSQQFWHDSGDRPSQRGSYTWSSAGVLELTLSLPTGQQVQERLWFASTNLRLRTVLVRGTGGLESVAFYSDIRRVTT